MEQVGHAVHENHSGLLPANRLFEFCLDKAQVKSLLVRVTGNSTESLCESFRVAVLTAWTYFGAASNWIPGGVGPFNRACLSHG